jgi:hypothetical protein
LKRDRREQNNGMTRKNIGKKMGGDEDTKEIIPR